MFSGLIAFDGAVASVDGDAQRGLTLVVEAPAAIADGVALGEHVLANVVALRLRLFANLLARLEELLRVPGAKLVHLAARHDASLFELLLERHETVDLLGNEVRTRRRGMPVETRHHHFEQKRPALGAHVVHRLLQLAVGRLRIVAVDDGRLDAEGARALGDVLLAVLLGRRGRDAPAVVRDQHQAR